MTMQTKKIEFNNETVIESLTFKEVLEAFQDEIEDYTKLKLQEELMIQRVVVNLYDANGGIVKGYLNNVIGWLEGGEVLLTGQIDDVFWTKEDNENK